MTSNLSPKNNPLQLITFAMTVSYAAFYVVGWFLIEQSEGVLKRGVLSESLLQVLMTLAWLHIVLSVPLRGFLFKILSAKKEKKQGAFFTAHLLSLAVRETGVILGFVAALQSDSLTPLTYTALAGVLINIATWPRSAPE